MCHRTKEYFCSPRLVDFFLQFSASFFAFFILLLLVLFMLFSASQRVDSRKRSQLNSELDELTRQERRYNEDVQYLNKHMRDFCASPAHQFHQHHQHDSFLTSAVQQHPHPQFKGLSLSLWLADCLTVLTSRIPCRCLSCFAWLGHSHIFLVDCVVCFFLLACLLPCLRACMDGWMGGLIDCLFVCLFVCFLFFFL